MDEKDTCDGGRPDRSCLDYQRANDIQGADSMMDVHDPLMFKCQIYENNEGFDLERVNTALNSHVNIFNLYGSFSS